MQDTECALIHVCKELYKLSEFRVQVLALLRKRLVDLLVQTQLCQELEIVVLRVLRQHFVVGDKLHFERQG